MEKIKIQLSPYKECTGCAACAGACGKEAISFCEDTEGFFYPEIDYAKCVACHLCQKSCPVLFPITPYKPGKCYAAWSLDKDIRTNSSSGGIFSELARSVLLSKGLVVGASLDDTTGIVYHRIIEQMTDLFLLQGSKYVQSIISVDILRKVKVALREGRLVLFTGTPCQIAGVVALTKNPENLFTMDIVCHGVPSPKWFRIIHGEVRQRIRGFVNYNFRKLSSWSGCSNVNVNVNVNGVIENRDLYGLETCYQDAFLKGLLHRNNCYSCNYADTRRVADVTVADFWGIGSKMSISDDHRLGCSLMLINSSKGEQLFESIKDRIYAELRDVDETIEAGNEQLRRPSHRPYERETFYADAFSMPLKHLIKKYRLVYKQSPSLINSIILRVKSMIKYFIR